MWSNGENLRLKGVIILKICISEYFGFFWIFLEFIFDFSLMKIVKKGVNFLQDPRRTRDAQSWRGAQDPRECNATRKATWQSCASPRGFMRTRTRGRGHASQRGRPSGATWQGDWQVKSPRVSGPWWVYWGANARVLFRPTSYTHRFFLFPPCGTMFPWSLTLAGHVAASQALDAIAMTEMSRSRGLVSTRYPSQARAQNEE